MIFLAVVLAYLLGSIPTSVWIGQAFYGIDVREYGSGNAGATNTFRVLGKKAGIPVFLFDVLKAWFSVYLATLFGMPESMEFKIILGLMALLGHIFPIYVGFRGGKGIACLLGILLAVHWSAALSAFGLFIVMFLITHYVSLSSMLAAVAFPCILYFVFRVEQSLLMFGGAIAVLVLVTHRKNIQRLIKKEEGKIYIVKKKQS